MNGYIAIDLDNESIDLLKDRIKPKHSKIFYHHMTVVFKPSKEVFEKYKEYIGKSIKLKIIKHCFNDRAQAVLVDTDLCENKYAHITLSCAENVKPAYSNELFDDENVCEDIELELEGKFSIVEFNQV